MLADSFSPHPFPHLAQPFHRDHAGTQGAVQCCMAQSVVCVAAVHQWILLRTLWCWHPSGPGHSLWLSSQSHSSLVAVLWPSWNLPHPQRWKCGAFACLQSPWLSNINPQGNISCYSSKFVKIVFVCVWFCSKTDLYFIVILPGHTGSWVAWHVQSSSQKAQCTTVSSWPDVFSGL